MDRKLFEHPRVSHHWKLKEIANKINTIIVYDVVFIIIVSKLNRDLFRIYSRKCH